jgi:hypothetical protein
MCELSRQDVPRLASHLGITPPELFREYLVVDEYQGGLVLRPRRTSQEGGRWLTADQSFETDPCIFIHENGEDSKPRTVCEIHDVKPARAATGGCWDREETPRLAVPTWTEDELRALGWSGDRYEPEDD